MPPEPLSRDRKESGRHDGGVGGGGGGVGGRIGGGGESAIGGRGEAPPRWREPPFVHHHHGGAPPRSVPDSRYRSSSGHKRQGGERGRYIRNSRENRGTNNANTQSNNSQEQSQTKDPFPDWRPFKRLRSALVSSSSSRGINVNHLKNVGPTDSVESKVVVPPQNVASEESGSRKKRRLGWGEGLAKYEHSHGLNIADKVPEVSEFTDCSSHTTHSIACSSSPGLEENTKLYTTSQKTCKLSKVGPTSISDLNSSINELLSQSKVGPTSISKLQVLKNDITKQIESTESEIDLLENELISLKSRKIEDNLLKSILASNKDIANKSSELYNTLLPPNIDQVSSSIENTPKNVSVLESFNKRKFSQQVLALKFNLHHKFTKSGTHKLKPSTKMINYATKLIKESPVKPHRNILKMPEMILEKTRFISSNGLVEDPCEVEKERALINPWDPQEKKIFMEKYAKYGKDFSKIASFIDHKTTADCVEFYYKNHKSWDCFKKVKKVKLRGFYPTTNYMVGFESKDCSERSDSCVTNSVEKKYDFTPKEEMCEERCDWSDEEKLKFLRCVEMYGRDFTMICKCVGTRSRDECKVFFTKGRKCLELEGFVRGVNVNANNCELGTEDVNIGFKEEVCDAGALVITGSDCSVGPGPTLSDSSGTGDVKSDFAKEDPENGTSGTHIGNGSPDCSVGPTFSNFSGTEDVNSGFAEEVPDDIVTENDTSGAHLVNESPDCSVGPTFSNFSGTEDVNSGFAEEVPDSIGLVVAPENDTRGAHMITASSMGPTISEILGTGDVIIDFAKEVPNAIEHDVPDMRGAHIITGSSDCLVGPTFSSFSGTGNVNSGFAKEVPNAIGHDVPDMRGAHIITGSSDCLVGPIFSNFSGTGNVNSGFAKEVPNASGAHRITGSSNSSVGPMFSNISGTGNVNSGFVKEIPNASGTHIITGSSNSSVGPTFSNISGTGDVNTVFAKEKVMEKREEVVVKEGNNEKNISGAHIEKHLHMRCCSSSSLGQSSKTSYMLRGCPIPVSAMMEISDDHLEYNTTQNNYLLQKCNNTSKDVKLFGQILSNNNKPSSNVGPENLSLRNIDIWNRNMYMNRNFPSIDMRERFEGIMGISDPVEALRMCYYGKGDKSSGTHR